MTKQPTVQQFRQFARDIAPAARTVCLAQAHAQLERERVNAYIQPILARYAFTDDTSTDSHRGTIITDVEHLYLSADEPGLKAFYADCDDAHRAHGFTGTIGHCPALIAENLLRATEREFLKLGGQFFGVSFEDTYGDNRKKALELLLGAALKTEREAA